MNVFPFIQAYLLRRLLNFQGEKLFWQHLMDFTCMHVRRKQGAPTTQTRIRGAEHKYSQKDFDPFCLLRIYKAYGGQADESTKGTQNKMYFIMIGVLGEFSSKRADLCNYYLKKEVDSMITELIEVPKKCYLFREERGCKNVWWSQMCGFWKFMQSV